MAKGATICQWVTLREALTAFAQNASGHQGSGHIKPLHWYVACRLVLEGGFRPEEITPRPPFRVQMRNQRYLLLFDESLGGAGERTVLGGLKTKAVDVVVTKDGIGPTIAVSLKGTLGAFRNLTNRMEEAVGDCTNLHISYPALVYGFLQVMRANRAGEGVLATDIAVLENGEVIDALSRYHEVLSRLAGRDDLRDVSTRYEAIALGLVVADGPQVGTLLSSFPSSASPLLFEPFFERLYRQYDQRFIYSAPSLETVTRRVEWDASSPVLQDPRALEYQVRLAAN